MQQDRYAVLYTRCGGTPQKLATMVLTPSELRITKDEAAITRRIPGLSLLHDKLCLPTQVYQRDQWRHLPPQLEALLPPVQRDNPQRIILSRLLAQHVEVRGMPLLEQEWEMLCFAGRNGIGHVDVFRSEAEALDYYAQPARPAIAAPAASALWTAFRHLAEATARDEADIVRVIETVGPTPGISGFNPKLYAGLSMQAGEWTGGLAADASVQALVKVASTRYPGLLALEHLAYGVHRAAGLPTPRTWLRQVDFGGESFPVLAIERFDRDSAGNPLPLESVFSLLRTGAPAKFYQNTDGTMEDVWQAIKLVTTDLHADRLALFSRLVLALLTGNGDLHLENWAVLGDPHTARLSPVYDPAPMRAYRAYPNNHDLLSALPFAGIGGTGELPFASSGEIPPDLGQRLLDFAERIGLAATAARACIAELLAISASYPAEAIALLEALPLEQKRNKAPDIAGFAATLQMMRGAVGRV